MNHVFRATLGLMATLLASTAVLAGTEEDDLKGFMKDEVVTEKQWEEKFRAIPEPTNLREYMHTITEEPHIAGLPGSKKVAEYILARFKLTKRSS